jgi:hypothetical protein
LPCLKQDEKQLNVDKLTTKSIVTSNSQLERLPILCILAQPRDQPKLTIRMRPTRNSFTANIMMLEFDGMISPSKVYKNIGAVLISDGDVSRFEFGSARHPTIRCFQINQWKVYLGRVSGEDTENFPRSALDEDHTLHSWVMQMCFLYLTKVAKGCTIRHNVLESLDTLEPKGSKFHKKLSLLFKKEWGIIKNDPSAVLLIEDAIIPSEKFFDKVKVVRETLSEGN